MAQFWLMMDWVSGLLWQMGQIYPTALLCSPHESRLRIQALNNTLKHNNSLFDLFYCQCIFWQSYDRSDATARFPVNKLYKIISTTLNT